jgi:hypothetical protein
MVCSLVLRMELIRSLERPEIFYRPARSNTLVDCILYIVTALKTHTLVSHLRLPQPGGPGSRICIPQEQGGPVIPPGQWVPITSPLTTRRTT